MIAGEEVVCEAVGGALAPHDEVEALTLVRVRVGGRVGVGVGVGVRMKVGW